MSILFRFRPGRMIALLAALVLLAACSGDQYDPGLIRSPAFANEAGRLARPWQFAHHASTDSYTLSIADRVARIERVGHEPWAQLAQQIDRESLPAVAGRRMAFSVDIRANLDDSQYGKPIEPSGLMIQTWQEPEAGRGLLDAMIGSPRSRSEKLALPANARIPEWQRHVLEFDLPDKVSRLKISAVLTTGGWLEIRNPSVRAIDD